MSVRVYVFVDDYFYSSLMHTDVQRVHNLHEHILSFLKWFVWCFYSGICRFDLAENKHEPMCDQKVVRKSKLTHVRFNQREPLLLIGDDRSCHEL